MPKNPGFEITEIHMREDGGRDKVQTTSLESCRRFLSDEEIDHIEALWDSNSDAREILRFCAERTSNPLQRMGALRHFCGMSLKDAKFLVEAAAGEA